MNSYLNSLYLPLKYHLLSINSETIEEMKSSFYPCIHASMHAWMHASINSDSFIQSVIHACMHSFIYWVFKVFDTFGDFDLYLFTFERHKAQKPRVKVNKINLKRIFFFALNYGINFQKMSSWPIMLCLSLS